MKHSLPLLFALASLVFQSCGREDFDTELQVVDNPVEYETISPVRFCPTSAIYTSQDKEALVIIEDAAAYNKEVGCLDVVPNVDFSTHFVLAGRLAFRQCASLKDQKLVLQGSVLRYDLVIEKLDCQKHDTVYFAAKVPLKHRNNAGRLNVEEFRHL
ncbi:hypothetical protein [Pedobacter deserti]|uniref:hypothetical protein n=1 Tax=Pedobacter deserti TaxID=2817382 RepID=UPI00210B4B5D|nr:hypothetical protein [Pedobacter sp. SYSU D00382]